MAELKLFLLGAPEAQLDGRTLQISRRRTRALLFYLAATRRFHSRAHLAALLWGDSPDREAARALSDTLYRLRAALGTASTLIAGQDPIGLKPDDCWTDLAEFEGLLAEAHRVDIESADALTILERALDLWRGALLDGLEVPDSPAFEEWLALERRQVEGLYLGALADLSLSLEDQREYERAIRVALRLLRADPLREEAHRSVMRLRALSGDRTGALRHYALCRAILQRELGISPAPETEELRARIARDELRPKPAVLHHPPRTPIDVPATPPGETAAEFPLVAREQQLQRLRSCVEEARQGKGSTAFITGEAGIGKSRLLAELRRGLPASIGVLAAACQETSQDIPLQPLVEALRAAGRPDELRALEMPPLLWHQLGELLPEVAPAPSEPNAVSVALPGWERGRLFEALAGLLTALARKRPLLLVLDDLHWSDDTTILFLAYLARRLSGERILLVGAFREEERDKTLRRTMQELVRQRLAQHIALERLSSDQTVQLVEGFSAGQAGSQSLGRLLHEESAGNPLFIVEMLHSLVEAGALSRDEVGHMLLPPTLERSSLPLLPDSLRTLIADRLERLGESASQLLAAAAVLGSEMETDLLLQIGGDGDEQGITALEELIAARVLVEAGDGGCRFSHDKVREVAYEQLSEARKTLLHRQVAEALEQRIAPSALLAYHYARGRRWLPAYDHALAAAEQAEARHANREAAALYTTAFQAAEHLSGQMTATQLAALYEARGRVWLGMSDYDTAIADFERALTEATGAGDERRALSAQRYLALAHFWRHEPAEQALTYAHRSLEKAQRLGDDHEIAASSATLASILVTRGQLRGAAPQIEAAIQGGLATDDTYLVADAVGTQGMAGGWRGSFVTARAALAASLAMARTQHFGLLVPRALFFSGINAAMAGDYSAALAYLQECQRYAQESDDRWWLARVPNTLGWLYQEVYDGETALRYNTESVEIARASAWPEPLGNALVNLGMDWLAREEMDRAKQAFDEATSQLGRDETMQWRWETRLWLGVGAWHLARGNTEQALALAARALHMARSTRTAKNALKARLLRGRALAAGNHLSESHAALARAARLAGHLGSPRLAWETYGALAHVEYRLGWDAGAEQHSQAAAWLLQSVLDRLAGEPLRASMETATERITKPWQRD